MRASSRRTAWLSAFAVGGVALGVGAGLRVADYQRSPAAAASRSWHGHVASIARARSGPESTGGLALRTTAGDVPMTEGAEVAPGAHLVTTPRALAKIAFDDGSTVLLDRDTEIEVAPEPRTLRVPRGAIVADVASVVGAPDARLTTPNGSVEAGDAKVALTALERRTSAEVVRGTLRMAGATGDSVVIAAGEEGVSAGGPIEVTPASDLAQRVAFSQGLGTAGAQAGVHDPDTDAPTSGLGELRARRPGKTDEKDHAVHLASHTVKIRIAGNQSRTEIDETFSNETGDDLEGVYRFPLPPSAQIERLALEVDGELVDGAFVDKAKGAAIWRGAIQNATPKPKPIPEEIFWVPGPWRDPALLEWQRGGRFELKIFPIPKHGSRRVVLAYTETVEPVAGLRRYVYPLPQSSASTLTIDRFAVDVQVLGADPSVPVQARGYELARAQAAAPPAAGAAAERLSQTMAGFTPSGDLTVEYALAGDRASDVSAWAFAPPPSAPPPGGTAAPLPASGRGAGLVRLPAAPPAPEDAYVALALRPKLPRWRDDRSRDQVLVLDVGRSMSGERFARARRLAEQIAMEMDRRDRLEVLVCDVACRAMPSGFLAPGPGGAHDVDAFLANVAPDGASDLVGALRTAGSAPGHDPGRDLRVVLLSDGVASAGYRRTARLAEEVSSAIGDARASVVAVPVGTDADLVALGEIARGGGGVVVPYAPGEALETAALDVLEATYGTTLRDVELTLPAGLHDAAPAVLAPLRAGSETLVALRMTGDHVRGDAILRGKVGGEPFEARYPLDVTATSADGNAFVPRLYAAARIADDERRAVSAETRTDEVGLSQRFGVPSRFTSLLVLESEAMFQAFGVDRAPRGSQWTGESLGVSTEVATLEPTADEGEAGAEDKTDDSVGGAIGSLGHGRLASGQGFGAGGAGIAAPSERARAPMHVATTPSSPAAAATAAPAHPASEPFSVARKAPSQMQMDAPADLWAPQPRRGGSWMKREWFRRATVAATLRAAVGEPKLLAARAAALAAPDQRSKTKDLVRVLAAAGLLDEMDEVVRTWSDRDPLDADAIAARADLLARRGDRDGALHVLGGIAAQAKSASAADGAELESVLATAYERAGKPEACAFRIAAAELRPEDEGAVARAIACERVAGHATSGDRFLAEQKPSARAHVATLAATTEAALRGGSVSAEGATHGDLVVDATWDAASNADLDVVIVDPSGNRAAWSGRMKSVRVQDPLGRSHEVLALSTSAAGTFTIEIVRTDSDRARAGGTPGPARPPIHGQITVRSLGTSSTRPFFLVGDSAQVARVDVAWDSRLVQVDAPDCDPPFVFDAGGAKRWKPECL